MQANKNYAKGATVVSSIALALILVFGIIGSVGIVNLNSNLKSVGEKFDEFDVDEQAIADAIVAGIVIPDMPEYDTGKIDDLWQILFAERIKALKGDVYIEDEPEDGERTLTPGFRVDINSEFDDWEEMTEYVEDSLEGFDEFESPSFVFALWQYDREEVGFEITQMGEFEAFNGITYNEGENSEVVVTLEYGFEYEKDDSYKVYKDTLYVTVEAEYDGDELEDLDVTYSL